MTPFEKAGYTKDTKFKVLRDSNACFSKGDIVTLAEDDGFRCPWFKTEDGNVGRLWLPNTCRWELELYVEESTLSVFFKSIPFMVLFSISLYFAISYSINDLNYGQISNEFLKLNAGIWLIFIISVTIGVIGVLLVKLWFSFMKTLELFKIMIKGK